MFEGLKFISSSPQTSKLINIPSGVEVKGDFKGTDVDFRIDGEITGRLNMKVGKIVIGESGKIDGNINCSTITIYGTINGNIVGLDRVQVMSTGKVNGNIIANEINIISGGGVSGYTKLLKDVSQEQLIKLHL